MTTTLNAATSSGGGIIVSGDASGILALQTAGTTAVTIDASQNVGIGTASPGERLTVQTALTGTTAGSNTVGRFQSNGNGYDANIAFGDNVNASARIGYLSGAQYFWTNGAERMRIDTSGNLLVGVASGNTKMYVVDTSTSVSTARFFKNVSSSQAIGALTIDKYDNTSTTSQIFVQFTINNQGTGSGQINANGASQAAFGSFSDARLKENIVDLPPQLDKIMALRPVEFDYIESEGGGHQISFIAQEFEQVYEDSVGESSNGMKTLTGWGKTEARLVKAIQEQQALITDLTTRLAALEAK